jgi:hypothetical protein
MIDKALLDRVRMANKMPMNQAAARLMGTPASETEMAVLSLMRWGLENGMMPYTMGADLPDEDQMMSQLLAMARWSPQEAMGFLANPQGLDEESDLVAAMADEVEAAATQEEAAAALLEHLLRALIATQP